MNITVNASDLATELRLLNHVVSSKPTFPILTNVLLQANEQLVLYTTDLEVGFRTTCRALITEGGKVAIDAKRLLDLAEQMTDDVQITTDKLHAHVRSNAFKSRLQLLDSEHFPSVPVAEHSVATFNTASLQQMITRVRYAITDKHKHAVNGALLSMTEQSTGLIATDGKRLSIATVTQPHTAVQSAIISSKALDAIQALFTDDTIDFSQNDKHLFFTSGDRTLNARMLVADFPKYLKIIPTTNDKRALIDRAQFKQALKRVGLLSDDSKSVTIVFEQGLMSISASSANAGDALEQLVIVYTGDKVKTAVNWQYVLDFLEASTEPTTTLDFASSNAPFLLADGASFINVVMLMRSS